MAKSSHVHVLLWYSKQGKTRFRSFQSTLVFSPFSQWNLESNICSTWLIIAKETAESSLAANVNFLWGPYTQKTHLIADTERHLGNFDIDKGVIHSCSFLHLIDVIDRMLEGWHCTMKHNLICIWHLFQSYAEVKMPYLWRFPEWPPDPCSTVQSLGDTFAGAHSTHGVLWWLPSLHRDTCNTALISTVASGWLCSNLMSLFHSFSHTSLPQGHIQSERAF